MNPRLNILIAVAFLFAPSVWAKRGPKPIVPPVRVGHMEIRAPNNPDTEGMIQAWDISSNRLLWSKRVYYTLKDPLAEQDVQWVFIKSMAFSASGNEVVILDELGRRHTVSLGAPIGKSKILLFSSIFCILIAAALIIVKLWRRKPGGEKFEK